MDTPGIDKDTGGLSLFTFGRDSSIKVVVTMDGQPISMEVDIGAAVSLISKEVRSQFPLQPSTATLHNYTRQSTDIVGELLVNIQY